jgi:hypothetical protein
LNEEWKHCTEAVKKFSETAVEVLDPNGDGAGGAFGDFGKFIYNVLYGNGDADNPGKGSLVGSINDAGTALTDLSEDAIDGFGGVLSGIDKFNKDFTEKIEETQT